MHNLLTSKLSSCMYDFFSYWHALWIIIHEIGINSYHCNHAPVEQGLHGATGQ